MSKDNIESIYSLSPMQLGMLFHSVYNEKSRVYVVGLHFKLTGALNVPAFKQAWQEVVDRHAALRTFFLWENRDKPLQIVRKEVELPIKEIDWCHLSEKQQEAQVEDYLKEERERGFHLSKAPLMRLSLIRTSSDTFHFIWVSHHILMDGWSAALLIKEAFSRYRAAVHGENFWFENLSPYKEYITWLQQQDLSQAEAFWRKALQGFTRPTPFPFDSTAHSSPDMGNSYEKQQIRFSKDTSSALQAVAQQYQVTLNTIIQGVWALLLNRYSNETDVLFGVVVSGRSVPLPQIDAMVGLFINSMPVRIQVSPQTSFTTWLRAIQADQVQARRFEYSSLRDIQSWSEIHQSHGSTLFDSILVFGGNYQMDTLLKTLVDDIDVQNLGVLEGSHYPLTLLVDPGEEILLRVVYDAQRFEKSTIARIITRFEMLLEEIIANPEQKLSEFSLLTAEEKQRLVIDFNRTDMPLPEGQTVVHLFEEQAAKNPDAVALRFKDQAITYAQLNRKANQLAHYLRKHGVGPEQVVALSLDRSPWVVIAILGTLKAGGAYVPLDSSLPAARLELMLEETKAPVILTNEYLAEKLPPSEAVIVKMDTGWPVVETEPGDNPTSSAQPDNLAYIIYTSGSTGRPKGAMLRHSNLLNYIKWAANYYLRGEKLDFPLFSSLSFDLTITSIYVPLVTGGSIVIYGEAESPNMEVLDVIKDDLVDIIKLTPAHLSLIQSANLSSKRLRKMIVGGEDFKRSLAQSIWNLFEGRVEIYNEYGPTEATVGCMIHLFDPRIDLQPSVPIGKPIDNTQIYILDEHLRTVPPGVIGEMCVGGAGVARGYLLRPEMTQAKFVANPYKPGSHLYRTGDLARWMPDGQMQFLGRADHQVKIKGYRIELGEVESYLLEHPEIETAVVTVYQPELKSADQITQRCVQCGLPDNYPGVTFNAEGVCNTCQDFSILKDHFRDYFKTSADLQVILEDARRTRAGKYDCMVLYSGGKDSTYMLYQLVRELGMQPLVFSLDNGYISEEAKGNIRRVTEALGVDLVFAKTPHMKAIFADSLRRHSNVCDGCFKVIYTLSINMARQQGIKYIFTGLSRGQLFETRLSDMFQARIFDVDEIDGTVLSARKAYHRVQDAVTQLMDVKIFESDTIFDEIKLVDFYRYTDVALSEMYRYLDQNAPWVRPSDTGRSTNCLINETGVYIHKKERGFHNYALPYSWDVRMGHKTRAETISELSDEINENKVRQMLDEVGYDENEKLAQRLDKRLVAYYVSRQALSTGALRQYLSSRLPEYMIPSEFIQLDEMPLTVNGKIDRAALPQPGMSRLHVQTDHAEPTNEIERQLTKIWSQVLLIPEVGINDNFFELGGDSIISIQMVAKAKQVGLHFTPRNLFEHQTIAQLALLVKTDQSNPTEKVRVSGPVALTPIQHWFFEQGFANHHHWNQSIWLDVPTDVEPAILQKALNELPEQHDMLRARYALNAAGTWQQRILAEQVSLPLEFIDISALPLSRQEAEMRERAKALENSLNLETGPLLQAALFALGPSRPMRLFVTCHHLVVDGVSWQPLLSDWEKAYQLIQQGKPVQFSHKTTSYKEWSEILAAFAQSPDVYKGLAYWVPDQAVQLPVHEKSNGKGPGTTSIVNFVLNETSTNALLHDVHAAYNTNVVDLLLTAWAQASGDIFNHRQISVTMEGHGREIETIGRGDLSHTVGWFTTQYPVQVELGEAWNPEVLLKQVKEQLRRVPNKGIDYGVLRYLREEKQIVEQSIPPVLFNYLGQFERALPASQMFTLAEPLYGSSSPFNHLTHDLELDIFVRSGQLHMNVIFNNEKMHPNSVQAVVSAFDSRLSELIEHCVSPQAGGHTPSDFSLMNMTDEQFGRLSDLLGDLDEG